MTIAEIQTELFRLQDLDYRAFQCRLLPTVDPETVIGVRTPALRRLAKQLSAGTEAEAFLQALPHRYFDENQLHAFLISESKDFAQCVESVNRFLPFIDNWATCDQLSPKLFRKHRPELAEKAKEWIRSDAVYTVRFGIRMLMTHFLDAEYDPAFPQLVAALRSEEYYVNMMIAWYFATALAKRYEEALPYLTENRLDEWTHNKAIQKSLESFRIPQARKDFLKTLKRKSGA